MTQEDRIKMILLLMEDYQNNSSGSDEESLLSAIISKLGWRDARNDNDKG